MRTTSALLGALGAGIVLSLLLAVPLARGDAKPATIGVDEIKGGDEGLRLLTVFKGTEPERFDVEVIGVLHHFRPGQPLIVVNTKHPRLEVVKTVRGMSGSPVFLDGRLAGAYAYSLSAFEAEPVAGVTPIDLMLTEMRRPIPAGFWPLERTAPLPHGNAAAKPHAQHASLDRCDGAPGTYSLEEHAHQLAARLGGSFDGHSTALPAATPLMLSGVSDRAAAALRALVEPLGLDPLQGGGGDAPDPHAPMHFVNGGGLGVQLARGDVSAMGLGTATYVDGAGKVAGFGHPMLGGGDEALPACIGKVLWINASTQASHKVGECARSLGTLVQDRQTAIVLDENVVAPTIPIDVDIAGVVGAPKTHWHAEITEDRFMAPGLAATVLASAVEGDVQRAARLHVEDDVEGRRRRPRPRRPRGRRRLERRLAGHRGALPLARHRDGRRRPLQPVGARPHPGRRGALRGEVHARRLAPARHGGARSGRRRRAEDAVAPAPRPRPGPRGHASSR